MAIALNAGSMARSEPLSTFTMSLMQGWDLIPPEQGGRRLTAGDLILLMVRKPAPPVTGPSGWNLLGEVPWTDEEGCERTATAFWKVIGQPWDEVPPTFTAEGAPEWEITGQALGGCAPLS